MSHSKSKTEGEWAGNYNHGGDRESHSDQGTSETAAKNHFGAGDSYIVYDLLPADLANIAFQQLNEEVSWGIMSHRGGEVPRLIAVQGEVAADGSFPIYRHPADSSPSLRAFSPTVERIRTHVERALGHPVNHVLIQHYRTGADYISEHSDKTVDVVRGSRIANVSLGAQRTMRLRRKNDGVQDGAPRTAQRIPLPHNSLFVLGPTTNAGWLHGIGTDKRHIMQKTAEEQAESGARISLTFRRIGTFLTADSARIYGQGATAKTAEDARPVVNGADVAEKLLVGFGRENHETNFDWECNYGQGFNVLHFSTEEKE